jgi:predicted alpha/beta superfamily hydrolase
MTIKSKNVNQEYRISVALPISYLSKPRQRYPTIYLLDANWYFGMVTDLARAMTRGGPLPQPIVVGIGYSVDESLETAYEQVGQFRMRGLTPVVGRTPAKKNAKQPKGESKRTGGASKFLRFIRTELIPVIETNYRTRSTDRILAGHSLGGLFVLYALLQQPKLFQGYIAGSPSLWYHERVMFRQEGQFSKTHTALPVKLYLGVGELKEYPVGRMVSNVIQYAACLESRRYKGFSMTKQILSNCDHGASTATTFQAGLQAVLT